MLDAKKKPSVITIEEKETGAFDRRILGRLFGYLTPYRGRMAIMYLCAFLNVGATLLIPVLLKIGIDDFITRGDVPGLIRISLIIGGTLAVLYAAAHLQGRLMMNVGYGVLFDLRAALFRHLQHLSFRYFDTHRAGQIMSRLTNDVQVLEELLQAGLDTIVVDGLTMVGITAVMLFLDPLLSLILLVTVPALAMVVFALRKKIITAGRGIQRTLSSVNAFLNESISGIKVIRSFAREEENIRAFRMVNEEYFGAAKKFYPLLAFFWQSVATLNIVGTTLVLTGGGVLLSLGTVTIGVIAAFLAYINRFFQPMQRLSNMLNQLGRAMASAERIFTLLDVEPEITDPPDALAEVDIRGRVEFQHVSFAYNENEPVLEDVSFQVAPGKTFAVIGPTGSGKTTIISLLARFYDPGQGRILVDGIDIRRYAQAAYRNNLALVMQDAGLFSGTIFDAVRYGKPDATLEEVQAVVRAIGFHETVVALPHGYHTDIGERGSLLSLGQKQLLAFARALIRDPAVLILDEASAYLDSKSERLVKNAMQKLRAGRTTFIIAHRLSTIRDADMIAVIMDGRIKEIGTHSELLERNGAYAELLRSQYTGVAEETATDGSEGPARADEPGGRSGSA
ncbi:MAG TPA: ABC transporter ATP-binding protein [Spirochaetia bacterium]|nr:ABC transporter ATP-binding protein [Spirochaetia bacterium]